MIACGHPELQKFGKDRHGSQQYKCMVCGKRFTEVREKPLGNMYVPVADAKLVLRLLVEGSSIRSASRITGIDKATILKLLVKSAMPASDSWMSAWSA